MRLVRSWPFRIPEGRSHVVDRVERLVIANHDYRRLAELDDDVLLLEWDIAVGREDLAGFAQRALSTPDQVRVAPYRIYNPDAMWAHRTWSGRGPGAAGAQPVAEGAPSCNLFGLGLAYLPRALIDGFIESRWARHFGDCEFSMWHFHHVRRDVPVDWAVRPVHLNYPGVDLSVGCGERPSDRGSAA